MNKKYIIISIMIFLFIITSVITINLINSESSDNINIQKADSEIIYLNNEIIDITNQLNNLNDKRVNNIFKLDNVIDWNSIEQNIAILYTSWTNIIIDLNNLNIEPKDLTDFGKILDSTIISVKNQNKTDTFNSLCDLYNLLIIYINSYSSDEVLKNNVNTKYYLLRACSLIDTNNWTLVYDNILNAEKSYYLNINSINYTTDKNTQLLKNNIYISIKELENIITTKDVDLFYFKYNLIMGKL